MALHGLLSYGIWARRIKKILRDAGLKPRVLQRMYELISDFVTQKFAVSS